MRDRGPVTAGDVEPVADPPDGEGLVVSAARSDRRYHTDGSCRYLLRAVVNGGSPRAESLDMLEAWGYVICDECDGAPGDHGGGGAGGTCPLCGSDYESNLRDHMPCEEAET